MSVFAEFKAEFKTKFLDVIPKEDIIYQDKCTKILYKNKLIDYLSLLLKHDWERSKSESSVNVLVIIGYSIYIISKQYIY